MGPEPRPRSSTRHKRGTFRVIAVLATIWIVLAGALPGGSLGAKPGGGSTGGACALVPHLHELSIGQGLPYPVLVRGKEILARAYLSRPQCSDGDDIIDITAATLTMTAGGATLASVGPTPTIGTTFPQIAPYSSSPAQDHTGDPKFVIGAAATQIASADRYAATFSLKINYRSRTASTATPVVGSATFPLPNASPLTATVEKKTAALRVLVQPLGDPTQSYSTWFTDADRITMQNAMTTLSRIFPVPDGTGDLSGTTGGVRYSINPSVLDIRSLLRADGKWCGTELNWSAIKATLAQHLQSWNTANPNATADVVVGAVSSTKSGDGTEGCAEAMSIPASPQMWVRSIPDARRAPSISGSLLVMEMAHYLRVVPETRDAFGDAFHSPYVAADGTSPNRGYNVFGRSYLADDRSVMLLTGTGWHNTTTLLERDDFAAILCQLGGATTNDCGVSGTVGTATGVGAGPRFVMSGRTNGTVTGTNVVESYFTSNVAPTQPDPDSAYRLKQYQGSTLLRDDGVPVIFAESEHGQTDDTSPAGTGVFAISFPASTAANRVQLMHGDVVLYERTGTVPPQIVSTTRLQNGEIANYTDDTSRDDTHPALTNDGKWVAWEAPVGDFTYVHVAPASDVGQAVQLGPPGEPIASESPAWCDNGTQLAYVDGDDIYTISVDTRGPGIGFGDPLLLYDADEIEGGGLPAGTEPSWSPDCSQLAFEASNDIWKIDADGANRTALTTDNRSHDPSWSQTVGDDRIAYQREAFFFEIGMLEDEIVLASHPGTESEFIVTTTADEDDPEPQCLGEAGCSLREAIKAANATVAKDSIHFALTGTAPFTITPATQLPDITSPVIIDGTTQSGWSADNLAIELDGNGVIGSGLRITAGNSEIRGLAIGRFTGDGITLFTNGGNIIRGNFIGTDVTGTLDRGNGMSGILSFVGSTTIGGTATADRNIVSGTDDGSGIVLAGPGTGGTNVVQGNYVGTDRTGTVAILNSAAGIRIQSGDNVIGGTASGAGNLLSGNGLGLAVGAGLSIGGGTNLVQGNRIGTDANGTAALPNLRRGIEIQTGVAGSNTIGGTVAGAGNLISGNSGPGMDVANSTGTVIRGNLIGTDAAGTAGLGNAAGVALSNTTNVQLGGTVAGARNVIAGNTGFGVSMANGTTGATVQGNWIGLGTDASALGNGADGVQILNVSNNTVGGTAAGAGNRIANNVGDGVTVNEPSTAADGNRIQGNSIDSNGQLGIDLLPNGNTPNDAGDPDTGPNNLQNFPVVTAISYPSDGTDISGTLNSAPSTAYTIEVFSAPDCDGSGFGEGQTFLNSTTATTDASGNASWSITTSTIVNSADVVTATATAPDGSTSEFSACAAPAAEAASFMVNSTDDNVDAFGCGTLHCSLREAINRANSVPGTDMITFNIPGAGPHTIAPTSALPTITQSVVIDATTEPGWAAGAPVIELSGASAPAGADALSFSPNGNTVRGLVINNWPSDAIFFTVGGSQIVEGNFIGTTLDGTADAGNAGIGVRIGNVAAVSNSRVGGTTLAARPVISGNGAGIYIANANGVAVTGNYIGTNAAGTTAIPNNSGVRFDHSPNGQVGGTAAGAGNLISGNASYGVWIESPGTGAGATTVQGNLIGTDVTGMLDLGNATYGVHINRSGNNVVGGTASGARNVISGNGSGIAILDSGSGEASGNVVEGNLIGIAADGSTARANDNHGVYINNAPGGVAPFPPGNRIGGTTSGAGNVIAANGTGVRITGISSSDNILYGNFIGVLADGTTARGNNATGVLIDDGGQRSIVGGTDAGEPNVIANNGGDGVQVAVPGEGGPSYGNLIQGNSVHSNGALGIDLVAATDAASGGVTPNDALDGDVDGGNELMNFPEITSATFDGSDTVISGVLDTEDNLASPTIDVYSNAACDPSGYGEGASYLGTDVVEGGADAAGHAEWSLTLPGDHSGAFVTATATDTFPNTSEFSECLVVSGAPAETLSWVVNTVDDNTDGFGCGTIHCSLREAIERANDELNGEGPDAITFDIPGTATPAAPHVIAVDSPLPEIIEAVVLDGSSEPDFDTANDAPVVQLDGATVNDVPTHGLHLATGASTVRGVSITNFRDDGVRIESDGNTLEGNYIGLEPDGVTAGPNGWGSPGGFGVMIDDASSNRIGLADGIETAETNRNIISGNDGPGLNISGAAAGNNSVENNYIGTNASGTDAVPNGVSGVVVSVAEGNSIGGLGSGTGNLISGNAGDGVTIFGDGTSGGTNFVQQNRIGTNATGTADLPNDGPQATDGRGVLIVDSDNNTIGGVNGVTGDGVGNLISGNATDGIEIQERTAGLTTTNYLTNNRIGLNDDGTGTIPNGGAGVEILGGSGTAIGGLLAGEGNVISGNVGAGVSVLSGAEHEIVGNAISDNGDLGIDLAPGGVTANDAGDADTGPNNLQNFPVIESVSSDGTTTEISGYVEDVPAGTYDVHFYVSPACDGSGNGEGALYLGMEPATAAAPGDASFTFASDLPSEGEAITATATDADGSSSEFSACATVAGEADLSVEITNDDPDPVTAGESLSYGISIGNAGPADATNVVVTLVLSEDVDFDPDANSPNCAESEGTVTCESETLASDGGGVFAIVVIPRQSGLLLSEISIAADEQDPDVENNTDSEETTVLGAAWEIWTVDSAAPTGSHAQLVSNGTQPSWGTDGQVAFARDGEIWLHDVVGEESAQVADTGSSDSAPALGGRVLGFQRTIPFAIEGSQKDVMLVREAEVITFTAEVAQPDNARFDIFFDCGGPFFPMAVGLLPDSVTATTASASYTYDSSLSCGSGTPTITAVVSDGVFRSDEGAAAAQTAVTAEPKPPVVAIYSPIDGETLLQFDPIAAHGWGKDPEDGQLADPRLSWTLTGPGGLSLNGSGHAVDFHPPNGGWTPSAIVGGIAQDDYAITLTGTDSGGNAFSHTNRFAILADADRDNLHAGIDVTACGGTASSADTNGSNAFADPDGDGIPSSDDRFTDGGVCTAEHDFSALANFDPDEFNIPATGQVATVSIRVPYKSMSQINGDSVRITEIGGMAVNITQIPRGWSVKDGVGVAKFDRIALAEFLEDHGMVGQRVTIVVEGSSKAGVTPPWSFEGIDSTMVKFGS